MKTSHYLRITDAYNEGYVEGVAGKDDEELSRIAWRCWLSQSPSFNVEVRPEDDNVGDDAVATKTV
jgi:hypothetical protein